MITNASEVNAMIKTLEEMFPGGIVPPDQIEFVKNFIRNQRRSRRISTWNKLTPQNNISRIMAEFGKNKKLPDHLKESVYDSPDEFHFAMELHLAGIKIWQTRHHVGKHRLDFAFLEEKIDVELDGITFHGSPDRQRKDQTRDKALNSKGWIVYRLSAWDAKNKKEFHIQNIKKLLQIRAPKT